MKFAFLKFIGMLLSVTFSFSSESQIPMPKNSAIKKYKQEYLGSKVKGVDEINWKGSVENCDEGMTINKVRQKAFLRINYFRTLCGHQPIQINEAYNNLAQKAALIIYANDRISHEPTATWKCYSNEGRIGAENSSLGFLDYVFNPSIAFITAFIKDYGEFNKSVPHRRSMLYSRAKIKGYGSTSHTEAIYNDSNSWTDRDTTKVPKYYSYPVPGYNEIGLVFPRWSFSIPDSYQVDFSNCNLKIVDQSGISINVTVLPFEDIYDPTLVWELKDKVNKDYLLNRTITVTITNVKVNGSFRSYSYVVNFFEYKMPK